MSLEKEPVSKSEIKRIVIGETFAPFEGLQEFLSTKGLKEGDIQPVLVVPMEFQGVKGFIRARANTIDFSEFETPLGEALTTFAKFEGNEEYRGYPVDLDLEFHIHSKEEFYEVDDYSCRIDFPNGQSYVVDCISPQTDEEDVPIDIETYGRYRAHSGDFVRDGKEIAVLLPRDLAKLASIKMTFEINPYGWHIPQN